MPPVPPPKVPAAFPDLRRVKPKTSFSAGKRARWKDDEGRIYEWDYQHGEVEIYTSKGKHMGQFNSHTGVQTQPAISTRTVEP